MTHQPGWHPPQFGAGGPPAGGPPAGGPSPGWHPVGPTPPTGPMHPGGPVYPGGPAYPPNPPAPRKNRTGLIVGIGVGAVVLIVAVVLTATLILGGGNGVAAQPSPPVTTRPAEPTVTPTRPTPTDGSRAATHRADSDFSTGQNTHGWECEGCRVEGGKMRFSPRIKEGDKSTTRAVTPGTGWARGSVTRSRITLEGVTFDSGRGFIGAGCGVSVSGNDVTNVFQVEVRADGTIAHYRRSGGEWKKIGEETRHTADPTSPGTITITCSQQGGDYRVEVTVGGTTSATDYRDVNVSGFTVLSFGAYGDASATPELSVTAIRYEATAL